MISLNISEEILKKHITYLLENGLEKRIGNLITVDLIEQIRHKLGGNIVVQLSRQKSKLFIMN